MLPVSKDLRQEALMVNARRQPLVILFSMPDCQYCPEVRTNYLWPLVRAAQQQDLPVVREIDITSKAAMLGFRGESLTQASFARMYNVRATPTVVMLDAAGASLSQALVGSGMGGFYGAYFERALDEARKKLVTGASDTKPAISVPR